MPAIPNLITLARLFLTPYIVLAIFNRQYPRALAALIVAGISDGLDGYLARTFRWTSDLGAVLDPIADKVLLCGIYLALGLTNAVPVWLMYVVFGRDLLIALGAAVAVIFTRLRYFRPSVWGKISTFLQIVTAVVALAGSAFSELHSATLLTILIRLVTLAAVWTCGHYYYRGIHSLYQKPAAAPQA